MRALAGSAPMLVSAAFLTGCASLSSVEAPQSASARTALVERYFEWKSALSWARYEFGCDVSVNEDRRAFDEEYGIRIRAIDAWYDRKFSREELTYNAGDEIMAGACLRDRFGNPVMRSEARFHESLDDLERSIRLAEGT